MSALKAAVVTATEDKEVSYHYLDRPTAVWWNQRKKADDTATFCGWYWLKGNEEAGPFKTRSSAIRDAYYRFVLRREPPPVGHNLAPGRHKQMKARA